MTSVRDAVPGFLAVAAEPGRAGPDVRNAMRVLGAGARSRNVGCFTVVTAGPDSEPSRGGGPVVFQLSRSPRRHGRPVDGDEVISLLSGANGGSLGELLPPFASATLGARSGRVVADPLGYQHVYYRRGDGWAAVSTSARALAACRATGVDRAAIGVQAMLGWQVGLRTPFDEVVKLPPGAALELHAGRACVRAGDPPDRAARRRPALDDTVRAAAGLLRAQVSAVLDDRPDIMLQLSGGQDSRILLAAVEPRRRHGLDAMTLDVPGSADADVAVRLARRCGMRHQVVRLAGLEDLEPAQVYAMALRASHRIDCSTDPIALAATSWAEARVEQRPRLAGLGGEVARGFYYLGPARAATVSPGRVRRLAEWRLFSNESVPAATLDPAFAAWARAYTLDTLCSIFAGHGPDWLTATDEFYLGERMHRWSGVLASATSADRVTINPMLDDRFLALVRALSPREKKNSLFVARLCHHLDPDLASVPMDGRPPPEVYAYPTAAHRVRLLGSTGHKVARKAWQRARRAGRPPAGTSVLAPKIAEHYRANPSSLEPVLNLGILNAEWLERLLDGTGSADPASMALLVNLEAATDAARTADVG